MEQLIEFSGNHIYLVGAFVFVAGLLLTDLFSSGLGKGRVDPKGATDLINDKDAVVIDVRPESDFTKGHIINAINIPINGFSSKLNSLTKYKGRPIIVSCRSGAQSSAACKQLRKEGHEEVFNLHGGIMAWQSAGLPVSRKRK